MTPGGATRRGFFAHCFSPAADTARKDRNSSGLQCIAALRMPPAFDAIRIGYNAKRLLH